MTDTPDGKNTQPPGRETSAHAFGRGEAGAAFADERTQAETATSGKGPNRFLLHKPLG